MMRTKRCQYLYDKLIELYTILYKESYPSADFNELVRKSYWIKHKDREYILKNPDELNDESAHLLGFKRDVPYNDFYIEDSKYDKIVKDFLNDKSNKFTKFEKSQLHTEAYLGCGPCSVSIDKVIKEGYDSIEEYADFKKKEYREYCKENDIFPTNILRD